MGSSLRSLSRTMPVQGSVIGPCQNDIGNSLWQIQRNSFPISCLGSFLFFDNRFHWRWGNSRLDCILGLIQTVGMSSSKSSHWNQVDIQFSTLLYEVSRERTTTTSTTKAAASLSTHSRKIQQVKWFPVETVKRFNLDRGWRRRDMAFSMVLEGNLGYLIHVQWRWYLESILEILFICQGLLKKQDTNMKKP